MEGMEVKNRSVLITGGLGNLGSWLRDHYCRRGYKVTVLAHRMLQTDIAHDCKLVLCDIRNLADIRARVEPGSYDIILHAASVNDGFVPNYFHDALLVNALGTRNLLEVLKDGFNGHFIYFSTFQVYGRYAGTITEATPASPANDYGSTHLFAEFYLRQFGLTLDFPYSIIRLTNSYGCPKDRHSSKWYLVLNDLAKTAFEQQRIVLRSNGKAVRDFIWMQEVCELTEKLSLHPPTRAVFNVSGQHSFSMLDIAQRVKKAYAKTYGQSIDIALNEQDTTPSAQLLVSSEKIRNLLGYQSYQEKFEEEAIKVFQLLAGKPDAAETTC